MAVTAECANPDSRRPTPQFRTHPNDRLMQAADQPTCAQWQLVTGAFLPLRRSHAETDRYPSRAAYSNSWRGLLIAPSDAISRRKNMASVQSMTTRTFLLKVGIRDRW